MHSDFSGHLPGPFRSVVGHSNVTIMFLTIFFKRAAFVCKVLGSIG
jgi:hypothetical protein